MEKIANEQDDNKCSYILASGSAIRQELLKKCRINAQIIPADIDEQAIKENHRNLDFCDLTTRLSDLKGLAVSSQYPDYYVISADQVGVFNNQILNKSITTEDSRNQLKLLQGHTHQLYTATSLHYAGKLIWHTVHKCILKMKSLSNEEISHYIQQDKPTNSVGGYYYEKNGRVLFESVEGERDTILGFEITRMIRYLSSIGHTL